MPFGLCEAPTTFYRMINDMMRNSSHKSVIVYLDDVFVYNRTLDEHLQHLHFLL
jgi:hypothetical protein